MKTFISYFKEYHASYYNAKLYLVFAGVISSLIFCNYYFEFERGFIRQQPNPYMQILWFTIVNIGLYAFSIGLLKLFRKSKLVIRWDFVLYTFIGLVIISIDRSINVFSHEIKYYVHRHVYPAAFYMVANASSLITMLIPLLIYKYTIDRQQDFGLYGLRFKGVKFAMYKPLLLLIIPLVFFASFIPEFIQYYPTYTKLHPELAARYLHLPQWVIIGVYEILYIGDFLFTEIAFRGLLVIGLIRFIGKDAILPMVVVYVALHFGKPIGETISSVFGGYILGVLALYSKNIWGGVALHCGVASCMEFFAWMQLELMNA